MSESRTGDRTSAVIAVGLALVGLLGAVIAWRAVTLGIDADNAGRGALEAARERSGAILAAEGRVAGTSGAWLAYEIDRRRAEGLRAADQPTAALREDKKAAAHWGFVDPGYLGDDGIYRADDHRDGIVATQGERIDLDPEPYLERAEAAEDAALGISMVGVLVAAALPLLTIAEVSRGRLRLWAGSLGGSVLAASAVAVALGWA